MFSKPPYGDSAVLNTRFHDTSIGVVDLSNLQSDSTSSDGLIKSIHTTARTGSQPGDCNFEHHVSHKIIAQKIIRQKLVHPDQAG